MNQKSDSYQGESHPQSNEQVFEDSSGSNSDKEQSSCQTTQRQYSKQLLDLARSFMKHRDFNAAESLFRQALQQMQYTTGDAACPRQEMLETMANIGKCCQSTGRLEEALSCYRDALHIKGNPVVHTEPVPCQLLVADILYDIGLIQSNMYLNKQVQKSQEKALQAFQLCLNIRKSCRRENDPAVANVQHNIGIILLREGGQRLEKALEYLTKALQTRRLVYGNHHPEVASSLRHIAMVYNAMGKDPEQAERLLNEAVAILRAIPGECNLQEVLIELAHVKHVLAQKRDPFSMHQVKDSLPTNQS